MAVITTSGTLVVVTTTVVGVVSNTRHVAPPLSTTIMAAGALVSFIVAALAGIAANLPRTVSPTSIRALEWMVEPEQFRAALDQADRRIAEARVGYLNSLRDANVQKGVALRIALSAEVAAAGFLVIAAGSLWTAA